ncbi:MAG TPA: hypothetical protein VGY58_02250 [Gemmataceae bacterium]|nr:hypothetical protein [Gemmataceae bacterium]
MGRAILLTLSLGVVLAPAGPDGAKTGPRAVVARALQAMGGEALVRKARAAHFKMKGTFAEQPGTTFAGESYEQFPEKFKLVFHLTDATGKMISSTEVLDGDKAWSRTDLEPAIDDSASLKQRKESAYVETVMSLYPLLDGDGYTLTPLPEEKVLERAAVGIKVSAKDRPDVKLYFDKASGLLVKSAYVYKELTTAKNTLREEYFTEYQDVESPALEEKTLRNAGLAADGPALLDFLRKHTIDEARRAKVKPLIRELGDPSFDVRDKAKKELIALGPISLPLLSQARNDADPEIASRAKECIKKIWKDKERDVPGAVIRLLLFRKPEGAAGVLLDYLPSAPDEETRQEAQAALAALAFASGQPDKALVQALEDKNPARRAAAATALGRTSPGAKEPPGQRIFLPGLKHAMKGTAYADGKPVMEWEMSDVRFYNRFADAIFAKPK